MILYLILASYYPTLQPYLVADLRGGVQMPPTHALHR